MSVTFLAQKVATFLEEQDEVMQYLSQRFGPATVSKKNVKQSRYRAGVAQRVPGS